MHNVAVLKIFIIVIGLGQHLSRPVDMVMGRFLCSELSEPDRLGSEKKGCVYGGIRVLDGVLFHRTTQSQLCNQHAVWLELRQLTTSENILATIQYNVTRAGRPSSSVDTTLLDRTDLSTGERTVTRSPVKP
jgi:hypothetical protein